MTEPVVDDAAIYALHASRLVALATALAGPSAADDVVAAAVVKVLASPHWPAVTNKGAYLTRAVVNEVRTSHRTALRRAARERRSLAGPAREPAEADPVPEIMAALAALPVRQRAAVFLTYWADLTPGAVADELGISEGAVRKHLARARQTLRRELS
ncbi:RNA polymerase sigma factor [Aquihabitans sp. McL0605]|uniref:RNA polymerase sigma factor n=1 Tax=Aquihabitans sp. McL0605 TaxID=3415671 RepID=UPI003CEFD9B1